MTEFLKSEPAQIAALVFALLFMFLFGRATARGDTKGPPRAAVDADGTYARLSGDVRTEVDALIRAGKKIEAIRRVRENAGLDLRDSKAVVDARARTLGV